MATFKIYFSTNLASSRAMSFSAPSAINADLSTVKFDAEADNVDWTEDAVNSKPYNR